MAQSIKSSLVLAGTGILLGVATLAYYNIAMDKPSTSGAIHSVALDAPKVKASESIRHVSSISLPVFEPLAQQNSEFEILTQEFIENIRSQYADTIENIAVQVLLKEFLDDLMQSYPAHGRALFEAVIKGAFPELAGAIIKAVDTMVTYEDWLLDNVLTLNDMPPLEYNGELWQKRRELFGEDADKIWSSEITAQEERTEVLQKTVAMLDQAYDTTMFDRIYILQSSYDDQYSETIENAVFDSKGVLAQTLFGFDSVQKELAAMSNEERQEEINTIRRTIGFDDAQIEYLAEQDQIKDKRWLNGYSYMEARQGLLNSLSGDELETQLTALREEYFKHEAATIAREERDEFFRYERVRVYGRN